jgi:hypothetical protein
VCASSCAATEAAQQPESVRPYDGPRLLPLSAPVMSSFTNVPMPQYTRASAKIRYFRSVRPKPSAFNAEMLASKSASLPAGTCTSRTSTRQSAVVTQRSRREPPVSWALASKIASTLPAQLRNEARYWL